MHAAPELLGGQSPGPSSDLYALASTLYELLAGVPAFWVGEEDTIAPLLKRIALDPPPDLRPRGVPAAVADVLELGLQKEPADRPDSVAAFGRRLQETQQACGQAITKMLVTRAVEPVVRPAGPAGLAPPSPRVAPPPPPRLRAPRPGGPPAPPSLLDQVTVLLESAIGLYGASAGKSTVSVDRLRRVRDRLGEPLRVAIVGRVKAGKSTLLNALVGEELAPTDAGECTRVVTWYVDGPSYKATLHPREGSPRQAAFSREGGAITISLGELSAESVERIVIEWPSSALRAMSLIDTPGLASISAELSASTELALTGRGDRQPRRTRSSTSPATCTPPTSDSSTRSPTATRPRRRRSSPSCPSRRSRRRSSERDGLCSARRLPLFARDPRLRRICQAVVPVAGLIAQAGVTLREDEFHAFEQLARIAPSALDSLLMSVDDFVDPEAPAATTGGLTSMEREELLERFGLFGIRRSIDLVRDGGDADLDAPCGSPHRAERSRRPTALVDAAVRRASRRAQGSGRARRDRRRVAHRPPRRLRCARGRARTDHGGSARPRGAASARPRPFRRDPVREEERDSVERLLGAEGSRPAARLGLPADASPSEVRVALLDTAARWQRRAENPLTAAEGRLTRRACSCAPVEGVLLLMDERA